MREILFRGKDRLRKFVFGSFIHKGTYCAILQAGPMHPLDEPYLDGEIGTIDGTATPVDPETVGQFTGEMDANDVRIFEGDIVSHAKYNFPLAVKWDGCGFELWHEETFIDRLDKYSAPDCTVIGNIYDIPELLKGESE